MHTPIHRFVFGCTSLLMLAVPAARLLHAQEDGPPNVLVIQREYLKPGKGGMLHDRSESAFIRAAADAKTTMHYFALDSMSGPSRSLFMFSYKSFADWERENKAMQANASFASAVDKAQLADGDLLASYDSSAAMLRPDLSLNKGSIDGTRYFEITSFVVKPGRAHEFEQLAHMYADGFKKVDPNYHWDCFQVMYGAPVMGIPAGSMYIVINTMKSLAEIDRGNEDEKKLAEAMGESGMAKMGELSAASIETTTSNLFAINPRMSYPEPEWVKKEPSFWKTAQ